MNDEIIRRLERLANDIDFVSGESAIDVALMRTLDEWVDEIANIVYSLRVV